MALKPTLAVGAPLNEAVQRSLPVDVWHGVLWWAYLVTFSASMSPRFLDRASLSMASCCRSGFQAEARGKGEESLGVGALAKASVERLGR